MPTVEVKCPACELNLQIEGEGLAGTQVTCPSCGQILQLEAAAGPSMVRAVSVAGAAASPSRSPVLLLAAGAGVMLLAIAVLVGGYLLGQSGAKDIADADPAQPVIKTAPVEPNPPREPSPLPEAPPPVTPPPAEPTPSTKQPTIPPRRPAPPQREATEPSAPPAAPPMPATPDARENPPPRKVPEGAPPSGDPSPIEQPEGTTPPAGLGGGGDGSGAGGVSTPPIVIQVPVPVPVPWPSGPGGPLGPPDYEVRFHPGNTDDSDDTVGDVLVIDNRTAPGHESKFYVAVEPRPDSDITVRITPPGEYGIVVEPDTLRFSPPEDTSRKKVAIRCGPTINPLVGKPSVSAELDVKIEASGLFTVEVPPLTIRVVRRNSFRDNRNATWVRDDAEGTAAPDLSRWWMRAAGGAPRQLREDFYRAGFVQLSDLGGAFRVRLTTDGRVLEQRPMGAVDAPDETFREIPGANPGNWE